MFITATAPNPLVVDLIAQATNLEVHLTWGGVIGFRDVFTWYSCYAFDAFDALFSLSARN
ncbi:anion transporter [Campylobacter jejuni]|uniref:Anion transporter n=1 Tax=Campylobacter jejuni subsp. jejuni serotype O:23/36 (strain 81-176) TaxID=354242 RepID=A0A0H3PCL0_CAMJJ|nr:anion transporter [Campylobacter jejuni]EAK5450607.1 anion transporter [Campylobacter hyointestinalis]EAQ71970.1 anion transporter [Campylobacter jejuni subsp. jejuni 81-176]ASQ31373.1 anion transporter [Campylobacter jejuni]ASQ32929.1 anion transporter [Campylobacter jejuni]